MATERQKMQSRLWRQKNPDYAKNYYQKNREKILAREKAKRQAKNPAQCRKTSHFLRFHAITHLGGKCAHCGEDNLLMLQIDHVKDLHLNGEKRSSSEKGTALYRKILTNTQAREVQVLCANCHLRKTMLARIKVSKVERELLDNMLEFQETKPEWDPRIKYTKYNPAPLISEEDIPPPEFTPRMGGNLDRWGGLSPKERQAKHIKLRPEDFEGIGVTQRHKNGKIHWVACIQWDNKSFYRTFHTKKEAEKCRRIMEKGIIPPKKTSRSRRPKAKPPWE